MKTYKYSEIFSSIQGEGVYTGAPTMWIRWFLCNLQCNGFGQKDPADESTYVLPWKEFDAKTVTRVEDMPVWDKGCDSSYSWAKKFKHLCPSGTASEIADHLLAKMEEEMLSDSFAHPNSGQPIHFCMTGGEPMMKQTQAAQIALLQELEQRGKLPWFITIETNGTQPLTDELQLLITSYIHSGGEWFWSVSPKLLYTSGEPATRAIKPEVVAQYARTSPAGQLKFVVSNRPEAWEELELRVREFRAAGVNWPVWIMPVGATVEVQSDDDTRAVVEETLRRGYSVAARVHCYLWGNQIGT